MQITVKYQLQESRWTEKRQAVVLVEKQSDVAPLLELLIAQDIDWEYYKKLVKVLPSSEIQSERELEKMCEYNGKTCIYDPEKIKAQIPFFMYVAPEPFYPYQ